MDPVLGLKSGQVYWKRKVSILVRDYSQRYNSLTVDFHIVRLLKKGISYRISV